MNQKNIHQRHTIPNANYPSFPCFQEEIQLKANLIDRDKENNESDNKNQDDIQFTMQDKWKMYFADMQNLKDNFDNRRRQEVSFKKKPQQQFSGENQPQKSSNSILTSTSNLMSAKQNINDGKYKAHLIRTRSKDSMEEGSPEPVEYSSNTNPNPSSSPSCQRRAFSDPTNNTGLKKQGFSEWMAKLEEINNMSRSTIDRIKKLEMDIFQLRNNTEKSRSPRTTLTSSKIPFAGISTNIGGNSIVNNNIINRFSKSNNEKSLNTDIDMEFMDRLLKYYNERTSANPPQHFKDHSSAIRRLTTTISRSVKIQTDNSDESKSFQDKGVITDDLDILNPSKHSNVESRFNADNRHLNSYTTQESIMDLPIIEKPMIAKIHTFHVCNDPIMDPRTTQSNTVNDDVFINVKTPEPIVEMYSDDDDDVTNFDDFEKNIFNEISRRAQIRSNRIISKSQTDFYKDYSTKANMKSISTQTQKDDYQTSEIRRMRQSLNEDQSQERKFNSTSKIVIERTRADLRTEKREILLQTDIGKDGKVRRITEIRNTKQQLPIDVFKIENESSIHQVEQDEDNVINNDDQTAKNTAINASTSSKAAAEEIFPKRTQSAFDLFENDILNKTDDDFLSNKAFSSLDISSSRKSPVVSEGYHSEQRLGGSTPQNHYLIEPPESFRETNLDDDYDGNETITKSFFPQRDNYWEMNNETLIENVGNDLNITTKSSTKRKPKSNEESRILNTDLDEEFEKKESHATNKSSQLSQGYFSNNEINNENEKLIDLNYQDPTEARKQQQQKNDYPIHSFKNNLPPGCKFSVVYNYGPNIVFRADFGISQLPLFETNL